jgi:uncharacterized Zn finger protein
MQVTIKAERMAAAGAAKMSRQGYTYQASRFTGGTYCVVKPGGANYLVDTVKGYCSCPFRAENGLCKHQVWVEWQAEADTRSAEWMPIDRIA